MSQPYKFYLFNPERQVRYYAVHGLDEGGFGYVWSGITDQGLPVAIKIIKPSSDSQRDFSSWYTEQKIHLQCLSHPYIVMTFDQFFSPEGHLVLVMEKAGGNLESLVNAGYKYSLKAVCAIGTQILSALHYIHSLGVIHRDVTLKNILWFNNGIFKLCDFGISKSDVKPDELAKTFIGHKSYIPPELLYAGYSSQQSDLYQLGLVLLSLLIGRHPIPLNSSAEQARQMILDGTPRQIADSLISTHGKLADVISVLLRRRDQYRYKTAQEVWAELETEYRKQENIEQMINSLLQTNKPTLPPWLQKS